MNSIVARTLEILENHFPGESVLFHEPGVEPALHLFHAPNSICSQKVRVVLAALGQPYVSHQMNIPRGDTYVPDYVRLRAAACEQQGLPFANQHSGSTAMATTGCDACVVPTLVDQRSGEILIDSQRICLELVARSGSYREELCPEFCKPQLLEELRIIDEFPNYPILAANVDKKAGVTHPQSEGFAINKVRRCDELIEKYSHDQLLVKAYSAKWEKELSAANNLFEKESMQKTIEIIKHILSDLNSRLSDINTSFLFSDNPTLADLFWGLELMRLDNLKLNYLWSEEIFSPLNSYYHRVCDAPALIQAVTDWDGARIS
ncbi:glutathione S-transferase family protein [Aestuariicella hydrocarbonica]|uniref:Glutathione S-transferase family protein n=1 Tax=Pseudomaricurvus hydrocarbonicus TaxID=1470433 RepID=A0A9E5MHD2_9GAMM|nr:glutathione S-transferase family protein [Aestuariicella hydrocarbonica]NHO65796.1 glutathione S-transferase family protein [Aestuariicella hydrocarbonica]